MPTISRKKLQSFLQDVNGFQHPRIELEQYPTSAHVAADILFNMQMTDESVEGMSVADLGCGPGILSIGACLLDASFVVGFEVDEKALQDLQSNAKQFDLEDRIDTVLCDVRHLLRNNTRKCVDTVILNPPFGTNKSQAGIDIEFLRVALSMAEKHVYSLHKTTTRDHVLRTIRSTGTKAEVVAQLRFDIPRIYKRHRQESVDIEVDLVHAYF